jgi:hypothetical protein
VAALITGKTGIVPELIEGKRGEFTIWLDDREIAGKRGYQFPADADVLAALERALAERG